MYKGKNLDDQKKIFFLEDEFRVRRAEKGTTTARQLRTGGDATCHARALSLRSQATKQKAPQWAMTPIPLQ
jgi:hypothetical protein